MTGKKVASVILIILCIAALVRGLNPADPVSDLKSDPVAESSTDSFAETVDQPPRMEKHQSRNHMAPQAGDSAATKRDCYTNVHKRMRFESPREFEIWNQSSLEPQEISSYVNLDRSVLEMHVEQGDSVAMIVLGRMENLAAYGLGESNPGISLEQQRVTYSDVSPEDKLEHFENAARLAYLAALHGRLAALQSYGGFLSLIGKSPVDLGWIEEEDYALMSNKERENYTPKKVYGALVALMAPNYARGPYRDVIERLGINGEEDYGALLFDLRSEFVRRVHERQLPLPVVFDEPFPNYIEAVNSHCSATLENGLQLD